MLLLYILWDDWPFFMISDSNEQLLQELEYTPLKPDCHSRWISKMQSGREDTLEERFAIKVCLKLRKMPQKWMKCFTQLLDHLAWIQNQFLSGIRDSSKSESVRGDEGCGRSKKVNTPELIGQGLGLGWGLLFWGFKGALEEIPSEEGSTLQIGSVAFPPG